MTGATWGFVNFMFSNVKAVYITYKNTLSNTTFALQKNMTSRFFLNCPKGNRKIQTER